jgi:uncharacterized protein YkwD
MNCSLRGLRAVAITSLLAAALLPTSSSAEANGHHHTGRALTLQADHRKPNRHRQIKARSATGCTDAYVPASRGSPQAVKSAVVCLINQQRTSRGLPSLRENSRLDSSAQRWTESMVATGQFTHGSNFSARISAAGYNWSAAGENVATGYGNAEAVVAAWMASPGHCRNILDPDYSAVGTGLVNAAIEPFSSQPATWTQDFALPMGGHFSNDWGPANNTCGAGG